MEKKSRILQKLYTQLPFIVFDVCCIPIAWYLSYWLRYNMQALPKSIVTWYSLEAVMLLALFQIGSYYHFKVHRGLWRFSSLNDVTRILQSIVCATVFVVPVFYLTELLPHIPRSVLPLYGIILATLLCSGRLLLRSYSDSQGKQGGVSATKRVLIVGAGQAGAGLVRDLKRISSYYTVGFIDDKLSKRGMELHGVRVLGPMSELAEMVAQYQIELIFIAIPSAGSASMRRIVELCEQSKVPFRTLPSIQALAAGRVEVNALREVNIEDLLGRDQVTLDWDSLDSAIHHKRVIVTGGGGSIGSELCRQVLKFNPEKLLVIDNSEFNLYQIEQELLESFPGETIELGLLSVIDDKGIKTCFQQFKPHMVFHAAAYKHVPMLENQVRVAVQNNILGTKVVSEAAVASGAEKFILISTDKAVNPTNVMGTTKRVAEIYCQNLNARVKTQFITVRFGNVLGSAGSVIPTFRKQLQKGGPLTVTHPDIQRYFMTIPEACQLILQAMINGQGGEIFVLDMGEPIRISYLAEQLIRLAGKEPGKDIHIQYTGLRPGEKLFEELFHASEQLAKTRHEKLFQAKFRQIDWQDLTTAMSMLNTACINDENDELFMLLKNLVPEFTSEKIGELSAA